LALSKAANRLGLRLILAGEARNKDYLEKCMVYKNVDYRGFLSSAELAQLYAGARLHALCSFVETPGLASLEAGAWGCNIFSTKEGSTAEYFEDMAAYCDPYDETNITKAIEAGLSQNGQPRLQEHILQNFSIEDCLGTLYESYLQLF
jgi:glycosyltransferase involved in cell wall biosynthesis